jgi:hypothetical protein
MMPGPGAIKVLGVMPRYAPSLGLVQPWQQFSHIEFPSYPKALVPAIPALPPPIAKMPVIRHRWKFVYRSKSSISIISTMANVDPFSGRGQREKKPTEKVKDTVAKKEEPVSGQLVPPKYKLPENDPKWLEQPKEIPKIFHHTKINETTGEKFEFYKLGPQ